MANASKYPSKAISQKDAEPQMVAFLCMVAKPLRAGITVDKLVARYNVSRKTAEYRLTLAQARWAAE